MRLSRLLSVLLVCLFVAGLLNGVVPTSYSQSDCTVTIQPGESIQAAVDNAIPGDVICLEAGVYTENISNVQSMTIRGAGHDSDGNWLTSIRSLSLGTQVLNVFNEGQPILFNLEDVEILDAQRFNDDQLCATDDQTICPDGVALEGDVTARLINVRISGHADDGLSVLGADVTLENSVVEINGDSGIFMLGYTGFGASTLEVENVIARQNGVDGLLLIGLGELHVANSQFSENGDDGYSVIGSFDQIATLADSQIINNLGDGIFLQDNPDQLVISESEISGNGSCGIRGIGTSVAHGSGNIMHQNRGADLCGNLDFGLRNPLTAETRQTRIEHPGEFDSLQEAIDAIAPGGTITLSSGTFNESMTLWKPVVLEGAGRDSTFIEGMLSLTGNAQGVEIRDVEVSGSPIDGILLHGTSRALIEHVVVASNNTHGIALWDSAQLELRNAIVTSNGINPGCNQACHGIFVNDSAAITIAETEISGNNGWGLAANIEKCGFSEDQFSGSIELDNVTATDNGRRDICVP